MKNLLSSLALKEEHRMKVSENRVLRKVLGPNRYEVTSGEDYIRKISMICTPYQYYLGNQIKKN